MVLRLPNFPAPECQFSGHATAGMLESVTLGSVQSRVVGISTRCTARDPVRLPVTLARAGHDACSVPETGRFDCAENGVLTQVAEFVQFAGDRSANGRRSG